jgi:phosphoglycerate dehydrogenase-like enzyme
LKLKDLKIFVGSASFFKNEKLMESLSNLGLKVAPSVTEFRFLSDSEKMNKFPMREFTEEELLKFANGHEIILLGRTPISEKTLCALLPSLKLISVYGVGVDHIDIPAASRLGIQVKWTPGTNKREVAELVLGTMINHFRNLELSHHLMRQGQWIKNGGSSLDGKKIGIVGLGAVGTALVDFLKPWNVDIYYNDIADRSMVAEGLQSLSFHDLLGVSDVISFHVPLDETTRYMLGEKEISKLKKDCLLINVSRGAVVEFNSVVSAIKAGKIGGFAVDVYENEPFDGKSFNHPKIYMTPHIGGNSVQAIKKMGTAVVQQIKDYLDLK